MTICRQCAHFKTQRRTEKEGRAFYFVSSYRWSTVHFRDKCWLGLGNYRRSMETRSSSGSGYDHELDRRWSHIHRHQLLQDEKASSQSAHQWNSIVNRVYNRFAQFLSSFFNNDHNLALCAVSRPWHALIIGSVSAAFSISVLPLLDRWQIDDPVGVVPIHLTSSIWGMIAVGIFCERDKSIVILMKLLDYDCSPSRPLRRMTTRVYCTPGASIYSVSNYFAHLLSLCTARLWGF